MAMYLTFYSVDRKQRANMIMSLNFEQQIKSENFKEYCLCT